MTKNLSGIRSEGVYLFVEGRGSRVEGRGFLFEGEGTMSRVEGNIFFFQFSFFFFEKVIIDAINVIKTNKKNLKNNAIVGVYLFAELLKCANSHGNRHPLTQRFKIE